MIKACYSDKAFITRILVDSFYENSSVNFIIKQDKNKMKRIKGLMDYSFDLCFHFGEIFYSENRKGCALILFPDKKRLLPSTLLDLKFIFSSLDFTHLKLAMIRESKIKKLQYPGLTYYLWFIGIDPAEQGKGIGSQLLREVISGSSGSGRQILLETSNVQNVKWYRKFGFEVYNNLDLGYLLYFMKRG